LKNSFAMVLMIRYPTNDEINKGKKLYMQSRSRNVIIVSGPNGAGKTTTAPLILQGTLAVDEFVNADAVAVGLSAFNPEGVSISAGKIMLKRLRELAEAQCDFLSKPL
jgi:predicted ABC-type ATPase